ncbi:MAG: hypothetical protein QM479_15450 [Pseudomonadota bacterium]
MSQLSRRHFIQAGLIGSAVYTSKAFAFDVGGILGKAAPYIQHAQPLFEAMTFSEADEIKMGIDRRKADDFFVTLNKLYPSDSKATTSLFSTHPGTQERIDKLEELAQQETSAPTNTKMAGWNELKEAFPSKKIA